MTTACSTSLPTSSLRRVASSRSPTSILPISRSASSVASAWGAASPGSTPVRRTRSSAAEFVRTIEQRQGWMIACIEEIAYRGGFIDAEQPLRIAASLKNTYYGSYLETVAHEARHQY